MKLKLATNTIVDIDSISQNCMSEPRALSIVISIANPRETFDYYCNTFTDAAIKKMEVLDYSGDVRVAFKGKRLDQVSQSVQDDLREFISVTIDG